MPRVCVCAHRRGADLAAASHSVVSRTVRGPRLGVQWESGRGGSWPWHPIPPRSSAQVYNGRHIQTLEDLDNPGVCPASFTAPPPHYVLRTGSQNPLNYSGYFVQNCAPNTLTPTPTALLIEGVPVGNVSTLTLTQIGTNFVVESDVIVAGEARILVDTLTGTGAGVMTLQGTNTIGAATTGGMRPLEWGRGVSGQGRGGNSWGPHGGGGGAFETRKEAFLGGG